MTLAEALQQATAELTAAGIDGAARDARHLAAHALSVPPDALAGRRTDPVSPAALARLKAAVAARKARQPVAQITGHRLFWGRSFRVTPAVLDPRPETETLIAAALDGPPPTRILDLGTGSGILALTLLAENPQATAIATDISRDALAVARTNACDLGLEPRVRLKQADWLQGVTGPFDLVVSNPPYIAEDEMATLSDDVRRWEPHLALTPGGDGLDAYRVIARDLRPVLGPKARILLEIGPTQADPVRQIMAAAGLPGARVHPDLDGRPRVLELTV